VPLMKVGARGEDWMCAGFEELRVALKEGRVPDCWINAEKRYINDPISTGVQESLAGLNHDE